MTQHYQDNIGLSTHSNARDIQGAESGNHISRTSVGQGYESTEGRHDYKTSTGTTYGGRGQPMDIGKSNNNFKDGKPKCFNCNKCGHMAKECRAEKKE